LPAKWIKVGRDGLVGKVLAYVKEPNAQGKYEAVIAASKMPDLIKLYMQLLGKEETPEAQEFIASLESAETKTERVGAANYRTTLDNICGLKEKFDCDIIEVYRKEEPELCASQPVQEGMLDMREEMSISQMYLALEDYFYKYEDASEAEPEPYPTYNDCTREEWKNLLLEAHESLVDPSQIFDYCAIERDLQQLCKGSGVPAKIVSDMCEVAKNGFNEKVKLLCCYKDLIFAIEGKKYEDAADLKSRIIKLKKE